MPDPNATVSRNIGRIRETIAAACRRAGRSPETVTIVAVTKGRPADDVRAVRAAGLTDVGENRVAEALVKASQADEDLTWHLIGSLQTNKARKAAGLFTVVHSIDRPSLAETLQAEADRAGRNLRCFLQVNISGEVSKSGVTAAEAEPLLRRVLACDRLQAIGLMTMAPLVRDPDETRPIFRALRQLQETLAGTVSGASGLTGLSMGMSQDFAVAVEEGATHVRIGTAIFKPMDEP